MSRYSSDSDSSVSHKRNRSSRRSSSSSSSSSSHRHKSKKSSKSSSSSRYKKSSKSTSSRNRRRSRSRSKSSSRHSRSESKDKRKRRSYSRDRYKNKHHHKSRSHSKGHSSRYYSRSSSNDTHSRHSRSKSKSPVNSPKQSAPQVAANSEDQLREKLLKAIKAAESADHQLKQQGVLPKGVKSRNDIVSLTNKPQGDVIKDIEADEFVQRSFTSSKSKRNEDIIGNIAVESVEGADANSIFHVSFFVDPKVRMDRWVKKLYQIRQRAISGEPFTSQ